MTANDRDRAVFRFVTSRKESFSRVPARAHNGPHYGETWNRRDFHELSDLTFF